MNQEFKLKHQFINASAGTGKTYTIMEIMMNLIEEDFILNQATNPNLLSKILILTFTEKATGELKKRLREKLQEKIQASNDIRLKTLESNLSSTKFIPNLDYKIYLQNLDLCNISTIHGFCNMIIREYELETLTCEGSKLVPIQDKIKQALYEIQHKEWFVNTTISKNNLIHLLQTSEYFNEGKTFISFAVEKYLAGREYLPHWEEFKEFENELSNSIEISEIEFSKLQIAIDKVLIKIAELKEIALLDGNKSKGFQKLWNDLHLKIQNSKHNDLNSLLEISNSLEESNLKRTEDKILIKGLDVFKFSSYLIKDKMLDKWKNTIEDTLTNDTIQVVNKLKELFYNSISKLKDKFIGYTIYLTIKILKDELKESKWISYDQMIQIIHEAMHMNPLLISSLRERFDTCIVDEFQDTDQKQYEIFRKIFFEDSHQTGKSLIVIGDPKQSIYGFRGADMETYFQAQEDLKEFKRKIPLDTNFRSVPELVEAYNQIFSDEISQEENNFFPIYEMNPNTTSNQNHEKYTIHYEAVKPSSDLKIQLDSKFNDGAIHIVKINPINISHLGEFKNLWADFISNEIINLVASNNPFQYKKNNEIKKIKFSDIAILVENKNQGILIQENLKRNSIPYSYYKERGIYQSPEAYQIKNIFECLLNPNKPSSYRKLLISDLFQIHPSQLSFFDEHSIESYEKSIIDKWKNLSKDAKFSELFRSIEQDTKILWNQKEYNIIWERKITNYRQIFQKLLQFQIKNRSDLRELSIELDKMIQEVKSDEEQPLYDKETEKDAVQILTLHASKGLEWPFVFLFPMKTILTNNKFADAPTWDESLGRRIWKMSKFHSINNEVYIKNLNENKRLYYVGITRAQLRLYLPDLNLYKSKPIYYNSIIQTKLNSIRNSYEQTRTNKYFKFIDWFNQENNLNNLVDLKIEKSKQNQKSTLSFNFFEIKNSPKANYLLSYSSLAKYSLEMNELLSEKNSNKLNDEEENSFSIEPREQKDIVLPIGKETGEYLHKLFEIISFNNFHEKNKDILFSHKQNQWDSILLQNFTRFGLYKNNQSTRESIKSIDDFIVSKYRNETYQILWNTTNALIPLVNGESIRLSSLDKKDYISEMLFHYKSHEGNLIKGYVDLIFVKNDKFYIADYKSNLLEDSSNEGMQLKIQDENSSYYLQRDLYAFVLWEYLNKIYNEEESLSKFGGVHFFFIRHMEEGKDNGIYSDINTLDTNSWNKERFHKIKLDLQMRISSINQIKI
ncbi:MAG: UvrD-helicase domain-containing protein [Leptospiraceae bacterium]|nr:UvrD-helicase domain-containing protein [Leptospiraceae bacterium]